MRKQSYVPSSSVRQVVYTIAMMLTSRFALVSMLLALFGATPARVLAQTPTPVTVPTWRYDLTHSGQNTNETALTPSNVNVNSFGLLFTQPLDGNLYAQPLYVPGLTMVDGNVHNVVFVATEHDSVYAFDADSNGGANANPIWKASLITTAHGATAGETTIPWTAALLNDIEPEIGITGTPVIDPASNTLYVVAASEESNGTYIERLHALNILTGAEQPNSPVEITATITGTGNGSSGGQLTFSPYWQNQRAALAFYNGYVYIAFASHGDNGPYHGWLFAYNGSTMAQTDVFCLSPNGDGAGIWASGAGLPIDNGGPAGAGRLYLVSGNGTYGSGEWGESILNFSLASGTLTLADSFTSFNEATLSQSDLDQGSGGLLMVPNADGTANTLINVGKEGRILVLNPNNLGGFAGASAPDNTNIEQDILNETKGLWSTPAYWNGNVYMWGAGTSSSGASDAPKMFTLTPNVGTGVGVLSTTPSSQGTITSLFPGASFSISSNGTQDGIAWAVRSDQYTTHGPEVMYAFDATDLTKVLYETDTNAARDNPGDAMKFAIPVVTNGKVYLVSDGNYHGRLNVYGLLNAVSTAATPVISPNGGPVSTPTQTVTITSATTTAAIYYTLDGSTPTTASTLYTGPFSISTDTTVNAIATAANYLQSAVSTATFTFASQTPTPTFTPAAGTYTGAQTVTITDADTNAGIYYTTNGSTPTASSTLYTAPITVSASETINAIAIDPALANSDVATAPYVIAAAGPTIDFSNGFSIVTGLQLNGATENDNDSRLELIDGVLNAAGSAFWSQPVGVSSFSTQFLFQLDGPPPLADGFTFTIQNVGPTALGGSAGALGYAPIAKSVAIKFDLYNNAGEGTDSTGVYTDGASPTVPAVDMTSSGVILGSGDGMLANVTYDGTTLTMVLTDTVTTDTFTLTKTINIPSIVGANTAYVGFTAGSGGYTASQKILSWTYTAPYTAPTASTPTPTFTPAAGTYTGAQSVAIADTDTNASIYYTTNGSTPTASSTLYTTGQPVTVSASETINAIAIDPALTNSSVATAAYVISVTVPTPAPTPTFAPAAGTYSGTQNVTIADTDTNASIYYTINGTTPTASSTLYTGPVAVSASETISAIAIDSTLTNSSIATAAYVISANGPTISSPSVSPVLSASTISTAQALTVTITVSGSTGSPTPTGSVALTSGSYASTSVTLANGVATINIPAGTLPVGTDTLLCTYTPDAASSSVYQSASGSNSVQVTVAPAASFTMSGSAVSVVPGATTANTSTITATPNPVSGFTGSIVLSAALTSSPAGALNPPTFTFGATSPVSISGTTAATATLTINTTAASTSALASPKERGVPWYTAGGAVLACILMFGIPSRRRKWRAILGMLLLLLTAASGVIACGGAGSGTGSNSQTTGLGTTAGAYTITVTGTSGAIVETTTVNLTVQ
jgi:Chitobiase/beta-hexosaminidase C-terminal domain/Legume lectin domain